MVGNEPTPGKGLEPTVSNAFRQSWTALKAHFWVLVGITLVFLIAQTLSSSFQVTVGPGETVGTWDVLSTTGGTLYSVLILGPLSAGTYFAFLRAIRGETPTFEDLLVAAENYLDVVLGVLLVALAVAVGLALLIVPGVFLLVRLMFAPLFLVDERMGPIEAIEASWEHTRAHAWSLFGFVLAAVGVILVGLVALFIGVFVAVPLVVGAYAAFYHDIVDRPPRPTRDEAPGVVGA